MKPSLPLTHPRKAIWTSGKPAGKSATATVDVGRSPRRTREVLRVIRAAGSRIFRYLTVWAKRARHFRTPATCVTRRDDAGWGFTLLSPVFDRRQKVRTVGPHSAAAMSHARHQKETHPIVLIATKFVRHS